MAYKTITIRDDLLAKVEAWANSPTENRSLSMAIEALIELGLDELKRLGRFKE